MNRFYALLLSAAFLFGDIKAQQEYMRQYDAPDINTTSGLIRGYSPAGNVHSYIGIPYAQPPIGDLRFEPPQPYNLSDRSGQNNVFNAAQPFSSCVQAQYWTILADKVAGYRESEDCLFVNIWRPANATSSSNLPVVVYIYGGAFAQGGTTDTDGTDFVAERQDTIFVDFNYRVNIFGFPNNPSTSKNLGLLDQRLAIEWIHNNIASFGGDTDRVVLMGQSAGSIAIGLYSYTYADDPLVSGWERVANNTKCANETNPEIEIACIKLVPARDVRLAISPSNYIYFGDVGGGTPFIDNETYFTMEEYARRGAAGQFAKLPVWIGNTLNEGDNLAAFDALKTPPINYTESDFIGAFLMQCPSAAEAAYRVMNNVSTYRTLYSGIWKEMQPYPWARAYHGLDIYHFFSLYKRGAYQDIGPEVDQAGSLLRKAVATFAKDPVNGLKMEMGWPTYDPSASTLINLFPKNTTEVTFENGTAYDEICQSLAG